MPREIAALHNSLGMAYGMLGDYARGMDAFAEALKHHQTLHNREDLAAILTNMATGQVFQQRYHQAE